MKKLKPYTMIQFMHDARQLIPADILKSGAIYGVKVELSHYSVGADMLEYHIWLQGGNLPDRIESKGHYPDTILLDFKNRLAGINADITI